MTNWLQQTQTAYLCALKSSHEFTVSRFEKTGCAAWAFVRSSGIAVWVPRVAAVFPTSFRCFSFCMASAAFPCRLHFYSCGNVKNSEQWIALTRFGARACCFLMSAWESPRKFHHRPKWSFLRRDDLGLLLRNGFEKMLSNWRCGRSFSICNYFESVDFAL